MAITVDEYRANWKYNLGDEKLQRFLLNTPIYIQWDDHEVTNNGIRPGACRCLRRERAGPQFRSTVRLLKGTKYRGLHDPEPASAQPPFLWCGRSCCGWAIYRTHPGHKRGGIVRKDALAGIKVRRAGATAETE